MVPRISLITPSYQQASFLEECLASVHAQKYADLEHIVVDGGSTDGSKGIIERHADKLSWWCSERDKGQSDAINKGLAHATGEVFAWINSDDALLPGALQRVGEAFAGDPSLMVLTGVRVHRKAGEPDRAMDLDDPSDPENFYVSPRINQQATFYRMNAVLEAGSLDERLECVMDFELWLQVLFRHGADAVRVVPWELAVFRAHAASKTSTKHQVFLDEIASVLHGLCLQTGLTELADVLVLGHVITTGLRSIPVDERHRDRVRAMVVHFLLKWHHVIFNERDFNMMRAFRALPIPAEIMTADQQHRVALLDEQVNVAGWWSFRLQRKWKHLVR